MGLMTYDEVLDYVRNAPERTRANLDAGGLPVSRAMAEAAEALLAALHEHNDPPNSAYAGGAGCLFLEWWGNFTDAQPRKALHLAPERLWFSEYGDGDEPVEVKDQPGLIDELREQLAAEPRLADAMAHLQRRHPPARIGYPAGLTAGDLRSLLRGLPDRAEVRLNGGPAAAAQVNFARDAIDLYEAEDDE